LRTRRRTLNHSVVSSALRCSTALNQTYNPEPQRGVECAAMLDGDFAFVIMDEKNDELYAARDPGEICVFRV
jgi:hypothetical protein